MPSFFSYLFGNLPEDSILYEFWAISLFSSSFEKYDVILIPGSLSGFPLSFFLEAFKIFSW